MTRLARFSGQLFVAFLVLTAIFSNGCGVYNNLTTYFNTFYNAKHLFASAVDEIEKSPQKNRDTNYFAAYVVPQNSANKFDSVIIKCSNVIQYHAESGYVPDALLMVGQCYYYQSENKSAVRKFEELINNFPQHDNVIPAKLWLAKTEYIDKKTDTAIVILQTLIPEANDAGKNDIELEATMLKAQIYVDRKDYDLAAAEYLKSLDLDGDESLKAIAQYQLAITYENMEKYDKAAAAYKDVLKFSPTPQLEFNAQHHYGMMLAITGEYTPALNLFDDLKADRPKIEDLALIELEIAKTYAMMDDTSKAFDFFRFIDTTYRNTPAIDKSNYERGLLFEYRYKDFKTALSYYSKVTGQGLTGEKTNFSKQKTATLTHYFAMRNNLIKCDSMLHPDLYKKAVKDTADSLGGKKSGKRTDQVPDSLESESREFHLRPNPRAAAEESDSIHLPPSEISQNTGQQSEIDSSSVSQKPSTASIRSDSIPSLPPEIAQNIAQLSKFDSSNTSQKTLPEPRPRDTLSSSSLDTMKNIAQRSGHNSSNTMLTKRVKPDKRDSLQFIPQDTAKKIAQQSTSDSSKVFPKPPGISVAKDSNIVLLSDSAKTIAILNDTETSQSKFQPPDMANSDVPDTLMQGLPGLNPGKGIPDTLQRFNQPFTRRPSAENDISKGRNPKDASAGKDSSKKQVKSVPPVVITPDSIRRLIVRTEFELAGIFFLELHMLDSAATLYQKIIDDTNAIRYIPSSLYALAELHRTPTDSSITDSLYNIILAKYPKTEYANKIKKIRGMEIEVEKKNPADTVFTQVAALIDEKKGKEAIDLLQSLVEKGDSIAIVPKALYTIGWIYENVLVQNDSAASIYKVLLKRYPTSVYSLDANPRVAVKDDTTKLSQFVKIKEIVSYGKTEAPKKAGNVLDKKDASAPTEEDVFDPANEEMKNIRRGNRDVNDDSDQEEPPDDNTDEPPPDDGGDQLP